MQFSTKLKIGSVLALIFGPYLIFDGMQEEQKAAHLEATGKTVPGMLMSGESSKRRKSRSYKVDVSYKMDESAPEKTKTFSVTSTFFDAHTEGEFIKDPMVQVRFDPANPDHAIIVGGSSDSNMKTPGIVLAVLGALGSLWFFVLGKKRQ